jgi:hypothetical protein
MIEAHFSDDDDFNAKTDDIAKIDDFNNFVYKVQIYSTK